MECFIQNYFFYKKLIKFRFSKDKLIVLRMFVFFAYILYKVFIDLYLRSGNVEQTYLLSIK